MTDDLPLGRQTPFPEQYAPELLFAIARRKPREAMGLADPPPFTGVDVWTAWELGWLDARGTPRSAVAEIRVPADSVSLVESKSLKLYLNSLAMMRYDAPGDVAETIEQDLSACTGADVAVALRVLPDDPPLAVAAAPGESLDRLAADGTLPDVDPSSLRSDAGETVTERLHSDLLRSLCPVTGQPDHGSVLVDYEGPRIDRRGLLQYVVSYRRHQAFHENCVERMFVDILQRCGPRRLTVQARYLRRGGIDINPLRTNGGASTAGNLRLWRQ